MRTEKAHRHILHFLLVVCCLLVLSACENKTNPVPDYPVHLDLDIPAMYPHFVPDNGFQTLVFTQKRYDYELIGYAGVLVWVGMDGRYYAADLCCSRCIDQKQPVAPDGIFAVCPVCGEHYDLSYGLANPTKGIARQTLRRFSVRLAGNTLRISN